MADQVKTVGEFPRLPTWSGKDATAYGSLAVKVYAKEIAFLPDAAPNCEQCGKEKASIAYEVECPRWFGVLSDEYLCKACAWDLTDCIDWDQDDNDGNA